MDNKSLEIDVYRATIMFEKAWHIGISSSTIQNCWKHIFILFVLFENEKEATRQKKELDKVIIFMENLNLLFLDSGIFPTMDVQKFAHYE